MARDSRPGGGRRVPLEEMDFYELLDVSKSASEPQIKKAYLKLARKWHPDKNDPSRKNECERVFKAITEAYDCLRDADSRAQYDRFGRAGLGEGGEPPAHFSFETADSLFRELFGGHSPFAAMFERAGVHAARGSGGPSSGHAGGAGDPFSAVFAEMDRMMDPRMAAGGGSSTSFSFSSSSSSSSSPGGGSGVVGRSTRTESVIRNGKRVTRTVTTTQYADGRTETSTDEHTDHVGDEDPRFLEGDMGRIAGSPAWHSGGSGGGSGRHIGYT